MLRVKFERYWNDYHHKDEIKSFGDLLEFENWMFNQMQQDYTGDKRTMSFPTPSIAARINAAGPWSIEFRPKWGGEQIWIHLIETSAGIIFSDGEFTAGKKHWSAEVQAWLNHCEERRRNPQFNFVKDEQPFGELWLRLGGSIWVSEAEAAVILGNDDASSAETLRRIVSEGRFKSDGDSYIPDAVVQRFNEDHETSYAVRDIDFEM